MVGILRAEFHPIGVLQRLTLNAHAVDERAVPAAAVLQHVHAIFHHDARVRPRDPAVAQDQVILRLPPDQKRNWIHRHSLAMAVGIHHDERRRPGGRHQRGFRFHLGSPRPLAGHARRHGGLSGAQREHAQIFHFARPQRLAMRAIAAHFRARQQHLKSEVALDLLAQPL